MSNRIARLLDEPEREVTKFLAKLEDKNGYPSHDARFLAEASQKVRSKLADLNLDPDDTTGEELYHALLVKFEADSHSFDEYFGAGKMDFDQKSAKAVELLEPITKGARQWGLNSKAAKDLLRQLPPKRLMKQLNYRSVESLLKREDLAEIYLAARYLESATWLKSHKRLVSKLDQAALEIRSVRVVGLRPDKWGAVNGPPDLVAQNEEIAALGIWPAEDSQKVPLLSIVLLLADILSQYGDINASRATAHLNGIVAWWADMDHLITELDGQTVSLSLKDTAGCHLQSREFNQRQLVHGRAAFWRELVSRYDNLPDIDGLFDESVRQRVAGLRLSGPEPAYEFVEDF